MSSSKAVGRSDGAVSVAKATTMPSIFKSYDGNSTPAVEDEPQMDAVAKTRVRKLLAAAHRIKALPFDVMG